MGSFNGSGELTAIESQGMDSALRSSSRERGLGSYGQASHSSRRRPPPRSSIAPSPASNRRSISSPNSRNAPHENATHLQSILLLKTPSHSCLCHFRFARNRG